MRNDLHWSEKWRNVVEIVAIVSTAIWTVWHFRLYERPEYEKNFLTSPELEWEMTGDQSGCYAIVSMSFRNQSRRSVKVSRVQRRAWIIPDFDVPDTVRFLDYKTLSAGPPIENSTYLDGPFIQNYPPGAAGSHDLVWLLRNRQEIVLFRVDIFASAADTIPLDWSYIWDDICGRPSRNTLLHAKSSKPVAPTVELSHK